MKAFVLITFMLCVFALPAVSVSFETTNQLMNWSPTWMFNGNDDPYNFNLDNPIYAFEDLCYTRSPHAFDIGGGTMVYSPVSTSQLIFFDNFAPLSTVSFPDTTYHLVFGDVGSGEEFRLCAFNHVNTNEFDLPWDTPDQAGDARIYSGATMIVEQNISTNPAVYIPQTKVKLVNCSFYNVSPYPAPVGSGSEIYGYGWGTIDHNAGDPEWIAGFDNPTGNILFSFSSPSSVVQTTYGLYNSTITLMPAPFQTDIQSAYNLSLPAQLDTSADNNITLALQSSDDFGTSYIDNVCNAMISKTFFEPYGSFPANIDKVYPGAYWQIGTNANTCAATVTFHTNDIPGIDVPENLRILRRTNGFGNTWEEMSTVLVSSDPVLLQVSGTDIMGHLCLASIGGNNLEINRPPVLRIRYYPEPVHAIELSWDLVPNALYYDIYESDLPDSPEDEWNLVAHLADPITTYTTEVWDREFFHLRAVK